jgi:hypothetical protein
MGRRLKLALLSFLLVAIWGCGGSGGNQFVGQWTGTWSESTNGALTGTWAVTIASDGSLTGSATSSQSNHSGLTGALYGTVDGGGTVNVTCVYPGFSPTKIAGTFTLTTTTQITGSLAEDIDGTNYPMAAALIQTTGNGGNNSFAGTWGGTWSEPSNGSETGTWTNVIILGSGIISGSATSSATDHVGLTGTLVGTVNDSGNVSITCTYPGFASTTITGTFVLASSTETTGALIEDVSGTKYNMSVVLGKH